MNTKVNYALYLVTGRELVPPGSDYCTIVEEAIKGGVSIVQVREKKCDTREFLEVARKTKDICRKHGVSILINDRIDIALAIGADGVHLGQTDMPVSDAKKLLPRGSIIGVSCNNAKEAKKAIEDGADYIGIGPVWNTQTKSDLNPIVGVRGVGEILDCLQGTDVKAVAIAGINEKNLLRTLHGAVSPSDRPLDGVAVVSAIMASKAPRTAAQSLLSVLHAFRAPASPTFFPPVFSHPEIRTCSVEEVVEAAAHLLTQVRELRPLIHQITNNVVMNQSANATLALGASPIMATAVAEMEDLSKVSGALLVNFGTISDKAGMLEAGRCANATRKPVVFDPVAVGATAFRRNAADELLNSWQASVIKGNAAEIGALAKSAEVKSQGVDSVGEGFADPIAIVSSLARKERCIIAMTGKIDWVSDGFTTFSISNGHALLESITGAGCVAGTSVATFCAAARLTAQEDSDDKRRLVRGDMLTAAVGGLLALTVAAEIAAFRPDVRGNGTFLPALIDELYNLQPEIIMKKAKVQMFTIGNQPTN